MDLEILRPLWLLGLLPAGWLLWRWHRRSHQRSHWEQVIDPELQSALLDGHGRERRLVGGLQVALALVWALVIAALVGPVWERLPTPVYRQDDALVLVLDLSLSMYARDVQPSRLTRMKHKVRDLLAERTEGTTALVVFAGDAHIVAPLTDDNRTLENLLPALDPRIMPIYGNRPAQGVALATQLLDEAAKSRGQILLLTDDGGSPDALAAAHGHWPVHIIGIGTPAGAAIPISPGRYLQATGSKETAIARLDEDALRRAADAVGGTYHRISHDGSDTRALLRQPVTEDASEPGIERSFDRWREYGHLIALLALPLLLVGFRRGVLAAVPLALCLAAVPEPAGAAGWGWNDLWLRRDQQAVSAMQAGDPKTAAELAVDPRRRGEALYRAGEHGDAAAAFARDRSADGNFNRGNALAHAGDLGGALAAYERTMEMHPDDADAKHNHDIVRRLLDEQDTSDQQSEQSEESEQSDEQEQSGEGQSGDGETGDQAEEEGSSGESSGESDESEETAAREEDAAEPDEDGEDGENRLAQQREQDSEAEQARQLETLLRRVPDDPGGLLRRKFEHETNLRRRRGERVRQGEQPW